MQRYRKRTLAVATAPHSLQSQMTLGNSLSAMDRKLEAASAYQGALAIAKSMEPAVSTEWVTSIWQKLQ
jgi:hypothetical protein